MTHIAVLNEQAIEAASAAARSLQIACEDPVILKGAYNAIIHLRPSSIIARVATITAEIRPDAKDRISAELSLAKFLCLHHAPVVCAADAVPAGPHYVHGMWLSLWEFVEHDEYAGVSNRLSATLLRELHEKLRGYRGTQPSIQTTVADIERIITRLEHASNTTDEDQHLFRERHSMLRERWVRARVRNQPLHGDAHPGNILHTPNGHVWADFEETCSGPVEWDVACSVYQLDERESFVEAYGLPIDRDVLDLCVHTRWLQAAAWSTLLATYLPERVDYAAKIRQRLRAYH